MNQNRLTRLVSPLFLCIVMLFSYESVLAGSDSRPQLRVLDADANFSSATFSLFGEDFTHASDTETLVTFEGQQVSILSISAQEIVAAFPNSPIPGEYTVTVSRGPGILQNDEIVLEVQSPQVGNDCTDPPNLAEAADLHACDLSYRDMFGSQLWNADLARADLSGSDLSTSELFHATLDHAVAEKLGGYFAIFDFASLRGAFLHSAFLHAAQFVSADLSFATLTGADLSEANFQGACLEDANLRGAILAAADLESAVLTNAQLEDAVWLGATCPDGTNATLDDDGDGLTCLNNLGSATSCP